MSDHAGGALLAVILFYFCLVFLLPIALLSLIIYAIYRLCTKKKKEPQVIIAHSPQPMGYVSPQPQVVVASPVV